MKRCGVFSPLCIFKDSPLHLAASCSSCLTESEFKTKKCPSDVSGFGVSGKRQDGKMLV